MFTLVVHTEEEFQQLTEKEKKRNCRDNNITEGY